MTSRGNLHSFKHLQMIQTFTGKSITSTDLVSVGMGVVAWNHTGHSHPVSIVNRREGWNAGWDENVQG